MSKNKGAGDDAGTVDETPPAADAPAEVTDAAAREGEQHFDPRHEWPSGGGSYVRQADGSLKRED